MRAYPSSESQSLLEECLSKIRSTQQYRNIRKPLPFVVLCFAQTINHLARAHQDYRYFVDYLAENESRKQNREEFGFRKMFSSTPKFFLISRKNTLSYAIN